MRAVASKHADCGSHAAVLPTNNGLGHALVSVLDTHCAAIVIAADTTYYPFETLSDPVKRALTHYFHQARTELEKKGVSKVRLPPEALEELKGEFGDTVRGEHGLEVGSAGPVNIASGDLESISAEVLFRVMHPQP